MRKTNRNGIIFNLSSKSFYLRKKRQILGFEKFPELKEWYYAVLDEMTCLNDFKEDYQYLAKRLSPELTPQAIDIAIKDMLQLGLIERDAKGKLRRPKRWFIREEEDHKRLEHLPVRPNKRKFIERGLLALDEQYKGESFCRQTNFPILLKDLPKIAALADTFFEGVYDLEATRKAEEVFHLSILCYRVTQSSARDDSKKNKKFSKKHYINKVIRQSFDNLSSSQTNL